MGTTSQPSSELNQLFHYNQGKKRKNSKKLSILHPSKKKKVKTWNHTFVCLSDPMDDEVPDSMARAQYY